MFPEIRFLKHTNHTPINSVTNHECFKTNDTYGEYVTMKEIQPFCPVLIEAQVSLAEYCTRGIPSRAHFQTTTQPCSLDTQPCLFVWMAHFVYNSIFYLTKTLQLYNRYSRSLTLILNSIPYRCCFNCPNAFQNTTRYGLSRR